MQALIIHDDDVEVERFGRALTRQGFMVTARSDQRRAVAYIRRSPVDLVILKQVIGGRHTTSVALAAEYHNPDAATILLSDRPRADAVELFEMIPSLKAIVGVRQNPTALAALALQATLATDQPVLVLSPGARVPSAEPARVA